MKKYVWGLAAIAIMVIGFAVPSQAASFKVGDTDWTLGGSARLDVGWRSQDLGEARTEFGIGAEDKNKDFFLTVPSNTRIFAKAVNGNLTGYTELGLSPGNAAWDIAAEVKVRHVYLGYDMGGGNSLLLGHSWTCVAEDSPNQRLFDDNGLMGVGDLYLGRRPQIRFIHTQDKMTFQVAIEDNRATILTDEFIDTLWEFTGENLDIDHPCYLIEDVTPAIALSLSYAGDSFVITPSLYAQQFTLKADEVEENEDGDYVALEGLDDVKVTSYVLALDAALKFEGLTLSGEAWWGQNVALIGYITNAGNPVFGYPVPDLESGYFDNDDTATNDFDITDVKSYGAWLQLAAPLKPGTLYVGAGYQKAESGIDIDEVSIDDYTAMGFFINYEYPIAKNFTMTPEVAYLDYGKFKGSVVELVETEEVTTDWDLKLGKDWFFGVHFQYDF